jgi:hypothetical protein
MADLISGILGGIGALGSLFGGSGAEREANRLRNRELDLHERALGNYEKYSAIGQGYRDTGSGYLKQQGNAYNTIGQYGAGDRDNAMHLLSQLLPQYAKVSGIGGLNTGGVASNYGAPNANRTTPGTGGAASVLNNRNLSNVNVPQAQSPGATPEQGGGGDDMYGLTLPQQEQLNQRVDAIRTQEASAVEEYRAALAQQGLPPNPAGEARIREQLGGMANKARSDFAESARAERASALQNLIGLATNEKQSGNSLLLNQASGLGNVAAGYGNYANSAVGQGEGGPYQQIANLYAQQSQYSSQRSDDMFQSLGQLLPLIAESFKSKKKPTSTGDWGGEAGG